MSDEQRLQDLFAEVDAPPGLDRWRERIADVHASHEPVGPDGGTVTELRPHKRKTRSFAVAAAVVAIVGLGGTVVMSRLLDDAPPAGPMIIDGPGRSTTPPSSSTTTTTTTVPPSPTTTGP